MWNDIVDQAAHFIAGALVALLALLLGAPAVLAALSALAVGAAREVLQHRRFPTGWGSVTDIIFWTLGGLTTTSIA